MPTKVELIQLYNKAIALSETNCTDEFKKGYLMAARVLIHDLATRSNGLEAMSYFKLSAELCAKIGAL